MAKLGEDIIGPSDLAPFFKVANADAVGIDAPENRRGDALRTWVRSLSGFQKEALVRSARTGDTWRLVSDEGPYLNGHDAAPCPPAFLSAGRAASCMTEILALADMQGIAIRKLKLVQDNCYTMKGSMPKRTMVGGAEPVDLRIEIDCDLPDGELTAFLANAVHASPLNGLMVTRLDGPLYFGSCEYIRRQFRRFKAERPEQLHMNFIVKGVGEIDMSGADLLIQEAERRRDRGGSFHLQTKSPRTTSKLARFKVMRALTKKNIHLTKRDAISETIPLLDPSVCARCTARIFNECAQLPGASSGSE